MRTIIIKKDVETAGDALDLLRAIITDINAGHMKGLCWEITFPEDAKKVEARIDQGLPAAEPAKIDGLDALTDNLFELIEDEDLTDDKLRKASEDLLPTLADKLFDAGYGTVPPPEEQRIELPADEKDRKAELKRIKEKVGTIVRVHAEAPEFYAIVTPFVGGQKMETRGPKFPWQK